MGAGENLPLNVLCEDGDISYRLLCYSVTGANTWVSLMQTTTILHVGTPPNPFLNCNNVPIRSPSSELLFSRKNMLWVRIRGVGCVSSYGFSLPSGQRQAWFKAKIICLVTFWQRKFIQRICPVRSAGNADGHCEVSSLPAEPQLSTDKSALQWLWQRVYHNQPPDSRPVQEFSQSLHTLCWTQSSLWCMADRKAEEKLWMSAMKCSLTAATGTSASELMGWQPGKQFHSSFHWTQFFFFLNELIWNAWKEQTKSIRYFNSYLCQFSQIVFFYSSFTENTAVLPDCIKDSTVERKLLALAHLDKLSSALFQVLTTFKMSDLTISNLDTFSKEV